MRTRAKRKGIGEKKGVILKGGCRQTDKGKKIQKWGNNMVMEVRVTEIESSE